MIPSKLRQLLRCPRVQILTTAVRLRSRGGDMTVAGAKGPVAAAALTVGVGAMIEFHETVDDAVAALISR